MFVEFAKGVAFLLALCFIQGFIARRWPAGEPVARVLSGILFGSVCTIGMMTPIVIAPGVIFDARSVILSMAGLFGGPLVGGIAAVIAGGYRLWLGGAGAPVGVSVVLSCVLFGLAFRYGNRRGWLKTGIPQLLLFGFIVHLAVVLQFIFLPDAVVPKVMNSIAVPMILTFTPATALLGVLLKSIDEQIRTAQALAESERRFKNIAESSSDWIWEMGPDLRFTYFSGHADSATGYDPAPRIGQRREDGVPRAELDGNREKWDAHRADLEARRPFRNFEYMVDGGDRGMRYVRISGTPVFAPNGAFLGYHGSGTDITAEKKAEQVLRESEEKLRDVFDGLEIGIYVWTPTKGRVFVNRACVEMFGYESLEALMQVPLGGLVAAHDRDRLMRYLGEMQDGDFGSREYEYDGLRKDGTHVPIQAMARRIVWDGEPAILRTFIDLTDRKRAEEQLRQAQKMEAVGQLTGGIAHDFNNILTAVTGNLGLAAKQLEKGSDVGELVHYALDAAWRGAKLTGRLLAFSRKQALSPQAIDARDLVNRMTDLLKSTVEASIDIDVRSAPDLWVCEIDPNQLESAILNLAINARDAMPDGGRLVIETRNAAVGMDDPATRAGVAPGDYVAVSVADTGSGMTPETIEKAFEPFFTSKDVGKGTGLGLSMVYGFVRQSGGHVTIESELGKGTVVTLYLPRSEARAAQSRESSLSELPGARGETVLVVEDDPDVRRVTVTLLSRLGYDILEATDGESALAVVKAAPRIDLLFTDVVLPGGIKGTDLAVEFRRRHPGAAILYTSGYTEETVFSRAPADGGETLLNKPFRLEDLAREVRDAIDSDRH